MKYEKKFFFLVSIMQFMCGYSDLMSSLDNLKEIRITIFVHGIISLKHHLSVANTFRLITDKIAGTIYKESIHLIRNDPFFYQHHAMQKPGLALIDQTQVNPGAGAAATIHALESIEQLNRKSIILARSYTYGWSGLLSPRMREIEAEEFYEALEQLTKNLNGEGFSPQIRIIAYSHGGSVVLNLARAQEKKYKEKSSLFINELILLGMPVLPESELLIQSPLFGKIYHFYSYGDRVQPIDCFALNRFLSKRTFRKQTQKNQLKLTQINIKIKRPSCKLLKYGNFKDQKKLPKRLHLRNADPGHSELWQFGWTPSSYRENFPLYPLPLVAFAPYVISKLEDFDLCGRTIYVELHPYCEKMVLSDKQARFYKIIDSASLEDLEIIKSRIMHYRPDVFDIVTYNNKITAAIEQAKQVRKEEKYYLWLKKSKRLNRVPQSLPKISKIIHA